MANENHPLGSQVETGSIPSHEEIDAQLTRIVTSDDFDPTTRSRKFLRFIVKCTLENLQNTISQYAIATQVLGRQENFDSTNDPIVRIQAGRLRRSLDRYYLTSGTGDPVEISMPKGSYVPRFAYRNVDPAAPGGGAIRGHALKDVLHDASEWPAVLISPFRNLTGDPQHDYLALGLPTELGIELDRYRVARVYMQDSADERKHSPTSASRAVPAKFRIEGTLEARGGNLGVHLRLLDSTTGMQIWGRTFRGQSTDPNFPTFLDKVALAVAAALGDERGVIIRHLIREQRSIPVKNAAYHDAILRFYHFFRNPTPDEYHKILEAMRRAVELEPERGLPWCLLARLHGLNHILVLGPEEASPDETLRLARKAVQLEPDDARCRAGLAYLCTIFDHLNEARREAEISLALDPNSLHCVDLVGYLLVLLGDWDRGTALIEKSIQLNPFHARVAHYALWLNHMRTGDYDQAYQEALELGSFGRYWPPLARATALGHLGRQEEARKAVDELLDYMPDFPKRWHWVLSRFVKFKDLENCIVEGLGKAGLHLKE